MVSASLLRWSSSLYSISNHCGQSLSELILKAQGSLSVNFLPLHSYYDMEVLLHRFDHQDQANSLLTCCLYLSYGVRVCEWCRARRNSRQEVVDSADE